MATAPAALRAPWAAADAEGTPAGKEDVLYRVDQSAYDRFFYYSGNRDEPRHVYEARDNRFAKFWLEPVRIQRNGGLKRPEKLRVQRTIEENHGVLMEAWIDYFND